MNAPKRSAPPLAVLLLVVLLCANLTLPAQPAAHIGYVYPAGGRQGTSFQIVVGGQNLSAVSNAFISGADVSTAVVEINRPMPQMEFNKLRDQMKQLQDKRQSRTNVWTAADANLLAEIRAKILKNPPNRQANPAIADTVTLNVTIATNAEPGAREIRLHAPNSLSNPLAFQIGDLPEYSKPPARASSPDVDRLLERFGRPPAATNSRTEMRIALPATVNGQIMPGSADRFRFTARQGQDLVFCAETRALIPFLADAVPGWFEATLTLLDAKGNELAYDQRFDFRPEPVIHFRVPKDGEYAVEIKDSLYRGREDFVYRINMGELPFLTGMFPLGGTAGASTSVELQGWNLPASTTAINNEKREPGIYAVSVVGDTRLVDSLPFAVDSIPDCLEKQPNNSQDTAQALTLPTIVNGRISKPGDWDVFRLEGRAGQSVVAEVCARRLGSPLDSVLKLTDSTGHQLAFNDDYEDKAAGLETHHADSYLTVTLPADGTYYVHVGDAQRHGGPEYAYRLRLSAPQPDYVLRVVPASLTVRAGMSVPVTVHVVRRDGFTNAVDLRLKDAPTGFTLSGARVPENQDKAQFTLKAAPGNSSEPLTLYLEGSAHVGGVRIVHPAVPAQEMMQAFAYWHLVPVQELKVAVAGNPRPFANNAVKILTATPIKIPLGGTASVRVTTPTAAFADRFDLELNGAPEGLAIQNVTPSSNGIDILLSCDAAKSKVGTMGNLIVDLVPKRPATPQAATKPANQRRITAGSLPAFPFEVSAE